MISFCKVKLVSFSLTEKLAKHSLGQRRVIVGAQNRALRIS